MNKQKLNYRAPQAAWGELDSSCALCQMSGQTEPINYEEVDW